MSGIGEQLRAAREARGLTLEQAERQTRIRAKLLAALEAGDLSLFASPAQARGFLRNYADFLELDPSAVLAAPAPEKAKGRPAGRAAPPPVQGQPAVRGGWRRIFTRDLFIGVVFTLLLALLLAWGGWQLWQSVTAPAPTPTPVVPTLAPGLTAPPTASATPTEPPATPTEPLPTPRPNYVGVNLLIRAEQRLWLRVLVDGVETFVGQLAPGEAREFVGNSVVEVWTGNGRGTRVVFNGQDQGTLGELGEVIIRLWTLAGAVTPTPTATATP